MRFMDLLGTALGTFRIGLGKSTLDASGITAPRTHTLPDLSGTLALVSQLGGGGGTPATTVTVTFPAAGAKVITQTVTVTGAALGQKVITSPVNDTDELEMDMLACAGVVTSVNTVLLTVASIGGAHHGPRNINLQLS
jgi:hypothetical protein